MKEIFKHILCFFGFHWYGEWVDIDAFHQAHRCEWCKAKDYRHTKG